MSTMKGISTSILGGSTEADCGDDYYYYDDYDHSHHTHPKGGGGKGGSGSGSSESGFELLMNWILPHLYS